MALGARLGEQEEEVRDGSTQNDQNTVAAQVGSRTRENDRQRLVQRRLNDFLFGCKERCRAQCRANSTPRVRALRGTRRGPWLRLGRLVQGRTGVDSYLGRGTLATQSKISGPINPRLSLLSSLPAISPSEGR